MNSPLAANSQSICLSLMKGEVNAVITINYDYYRPMQ